MTAAAKPWRPTREGIELRIRLTPKSSRDRVEGLEATADGLAVKARVRAVPEDGKANAAAARLIAEWLRLPGRSVSLAGGGKSRVKTLAIAGDPDTLSATVDAALATLQKVS